MARTEQEQELVLGNKQLLSAFFVVVALLGVFFTAGYIIGRNTGAKSSAADLAANASPATDAANRTANRGVETVSVSPATIVQEPKPDTKPEEPAAEPPTTKPVVPEKKPPPEPETVGAVPAQVTLGHQYLQLMAVKRPVADSMVKLSKGPRLSRTIG